MCQATPDQHILVIAKAPAGFDVTQLMDGCEIVSHVFVYTDVHLEWLDVLPEAYLFIVPNGDRLVARAISDLLSTTILVAFRDQLVEVAILPVSYERTSHPAISLKSALARFLPPALADAVRDEEAMPTVKLITDQIEAV